MFKVSRVEVIHCASGGYSAINNRKEVIDESTIIQDYGAARAYQYYGDARVTFHLQDDGRTLKIFVEDQDE